MNVIRDQTLILSQLIRVAVEAAGLLNKGHPVLLQSPNGKDAVTQLQCLTQLIVDPFFRTLHGFALLIEKEFNAHGHRWGTFLSLIRFYFIYYINY